MDSALKHRLIGAAVLSALAIIFLPMLIVGKDRNDTASTVPLKVPTAPAGDFETKELPLTAPASGVPDGGVVGLDTSHPAASAAASPATSTAVNASGASAASPASTASGMAPATASPATTQPAPAAAAAPASGMPSAAASPASVKPTTPAPTAAAVPTPTNAVPQPANTAASPAAAPNLPSAPIPAANAGGHYVVSLGTYSNAGNAQSLVASLKAKQLPAYADTVTVAGKPATRVRIGPFQQRGDAEAARLKAQQVRTDMPASVTALDAAAPAPEVPAPVATTKPAAASTGTKPATPAAASGKTPTPAVAAASSANDKPAKPSPAAAGRGYAVQVVAFRSEDQALTLRNKLRAAGFTAFSEKVQAESGTMYRVRIGPEADREAADRLRTELSTKMNMSGVVVAYP